MKELDIVKVNIIDMDYEGFGIAKIDGMVVFISNAITNELVLAKITLIKKNMAFGEAIKIIKKSEHRISDIQIQGGCNMLHVSYDFELDFKKKKVSNTIKKIALIDFEINDVIRNKNIYNYRNKVQIPFQKKENQIIFGYFKPKSHEIISMDYAITEPNITLSIMKDIRDYFNDKKLSIYDEATNKGILRNVMLRLNYIGEVMLVLVISSEHFLIKELINILIDRYKDIKSVYININSKDTNVLLSDNFKHVYGILNLQEKIIDCNFSVSPGSFLQVNHDMAELLYLEAFRLAKLNKEMTVIDAYSGIGSIALNMALKVRHVYGIEVVPFAVENAISNMKLNNINNVSFILGKCEDEIKKLVSIKQIDLIVFDPPRKGCEISFLNTVIEMKIPKIIYISCNISTASRDIAYLLKNGYTLKEITPVDMFSKTTHVESVILLEL